MARLAAAVIYLLEGSQLHEAGVAEAHHHWRPFPGCNQPILSFSAKLPCSYWRSATAWAVAIKLRQLS
jgi:hypothetical protein